MEYQAHTVSGNLKKDPVILCSPAQAASLLKEGRSLVFLVRHGQTDWNLELRLQGRENVLLNGEGIEQSKDCAEMFVTAAEAYGIDITRVYSSPLSRAMKTAEIISNALGKNDPIPLGIFTERNYGELSGLPLEERKEKFPKGEKQARGVESVPSTASRMKKGLAEICSPGKRQVLLVTHGGVVNALFMRITRGKIGTGKNITVNCGVCLVAVNKAATIPLAYNLTGDSFYDYIEKLYALSPFEK